MRDDQSTNIVPVTEAELPILESALRALAADLGDAYQADQEALSQAVCGPGARCIALVATHAERTLGAVLAAPVFSTLHGGAGLYVSDLWVAPDMRGKGLSRRLLAAVLREGERHNMGLFLKLAVYDDNPKARAVYEHLGFTSLTGETYMALAGRSLLNLKETS